MTAVSLRHVTVLTAASGLPGQGDIPPSRWQIFLSKYFRGVFPSVPLQAQKSLSAGEWVSLFWAISAARQKTWGGLAGRWVRWGAQALRHRTDLRRGGQVNTAPLLGVTSERGRQGLTAKTGFSHQFQLQLPWASFPADERVVSPWEMLNERGNSTAHSTNSTQALGSTSVQRSVSFSTGGHRAAPAPALSPRLIQMSRL